MFDLEQKINEIQEQPEHIRMRWVYGAVGVCMFFIAFIWIISLRINLTTEPPGETSTIRDIGDTINERLEREEEGQSIDALLDGAKGSIDTIKDTSQDFQGVQGDVGNSLGSVLDNEESADSEEVSEF